GPRPVRELGARRAHGRIAGHREHRAGDPGLARHPRGEDVMSKRITSALVVDDDDAFRTTLQGALRRRGVRARTAATVEEGLVVLEADAADLIVLDYRMPLSDGISALGRYRRLAPEAAIVMLTGFGDIPLAVAAVREGADTLLSKPIDADRLL